MYLTELIFHTEKTVNDMEAFYGILIPFLGTSLGAACVFFMKKTLSDTVQRALTGFAAGVMVAASVWSLLIPAIEQSVGMGKFAFVPAVVGFYVGMLFLLLLDHVIPHLHQNSSEAEGPKSQMARTTMMVLAVTLHNIPEGMAVGLAFALAGVQGGLAAAAVLALLFAGNALKNVVGWLSSVLTVFSLGALVYAYYMLRARMALSYTGGQVQSYVLDEVIERLRKSSFSGKGMLLDIGCGNGALTIKAAKKWPQLRVVGIDSWGKMWGYSQSQCEENAKLENVAAHVSFRAGDAAKLSFVDETFDGAVSNFVFHEVRSQPDKLALFQEMLRVLKPGAAFVIQDTYFDKRVYGDINAFVEQLRPRVKEIHFEDTRKPDYAPRFLNTPLVLGQMGVIWGRK